MLVQTGHGIQVKYPSYMEIFILQGASDVKINHSAMQKTWAHKVYLNEYCTTPLLPLRADLQYVLNLIEQLGCVSLYPRFRLLAFWSIYPGVSQWIQCGIAFLILLAGFQLFGLLVHIPGNISMNTVHTHCCHPEATIGAYLLRSINPDLFHWLLPKTI